jgi:precorrin-6B methylase 2
VKPGPLANLEKKPSSTGERRIETVENSMTTQALREFINRHNTSATGLAALGAALDAKTSGAPLDPALAARVDELLSALGAGDVLTGVSAQEAAPFLAELRYSLGMDAKLPYAHTRGTSWSYQDAHILQAVGDFARGHAHGITDKIVPALQLQERLGAPGAAFLDIGVGVAGTAIEMAQLWPQLRIVGIDVWQPSLALARTNVEAAGLGARIELREQGAEQLEDERAFELVWVPTPFMPERILPAALTRALRALRPGGWLILNCWDWNRVPPLTAAMFRLRVTTWGGPLWSTVDGEQMLRDHGFSEIRTLPGPPAVPIGVVVGRRAAE